MPLCYYLHQSSRFANLISTSPGKASARTSTPDHARTNSIALPLPIGVVAVEHSRTPQAPGMAAGRRRSTRSATASFLFRVPTCGSGVSSVHITDCAFDVAADQLISAARGRTHHGYGAT